MPESNRLPPPDRPVQPDSSPRRRGHSATAVAAEPSSPSRPGTAVDTPRDTAPGWPGGTRRTARRQRTVCDLLGAPAIASVVVVVALWAYNQGIQSLSLGLAGSDSFGRLAGLLASDLMLLQVLLMARIPWVERAWGHDVLARRHRLLGMASFWFMMAHVVLITVEYAQHDGLSILAQLWQFQFDQRGVLVATVGTVLLIMVVGLSIRAARRRLRYESWHLLHLYTYLGMGLALPHQVFAGSEFNNSLPARIYWWTLYGAALAAVLVFRLGLPGWRSAYHRLRVLAVVPEAPGVVSVLIRGHRLDRLPARAGQFFLWRFLDGPGWTRANPYSLSAQPSRDQLRLTVQAVGDGSNRVSRLKPGTRVLIEGPYGALTSERRRNRRVLLIAAGVGITPMRALLEELPYHHGEATLLYRVTKPDGAVFTDELADLTASRGVRVHYLAGPRRRAASWLPAGSGAELTDAEHLKRLVPDVADRDIWLCGPSPWMAAVRAAAREAGVPAEHLHSEDFAW
ncbi:ferredoxin reductase family protein [Pseudonocardia sp. Cha107L01]|uniref:ferredoxin reductase family protein n=1 Tax=Pseudonocardia sp. Cha107L01 TaxID=3457576 RepID=UPI00403ECF58